MSDKDNRKTPSEEFFTIEDLTILRSSGYKHGGKKARCKTSPAANANFSRHGKYGERLDCHEYL